MASQPVPSRSPSSVLPLGAQLLVAANVVAAVSLVLLNKVLLRTWPFALALTAAHAVFTQVATRALRVAGLIESASLPALPVAQMALCGVLSVVLMNVSLSLNSVGIFQASKMLVVPATVLAERCWRGTTVRRDVALALCVVLAGVALSAPSAAFSSLASERPSPLGLVSALAAVFVTAFAVILIGDTQKQLASSPLTLLDAQQRYIIAYAVAMACSFEDTDAMSQALLTSSGTGVLVCVSSLVAVLLNTTGFSVLSLLSPLSYQVVSQFKTIATLGLSVLVLGEPMTARQVAGFALALCGIALYSHAKMRPTADAPSARTDPLCDAPALAHLCKSRLASAWCAALIALAASCSFASQILWVGRAPKAQLANSLMAPCNATLEAPFQCVKWDVIVCAHARMEAHILRDWVLWNHAAGVQHFVVMDNNDIGPDGMRDDFDGALAPFDRELVTTLKYPKDVMNNISLADQYGLRRADFEGLNLMDDNPLKQRCHDLYRSRARWIAFIDTDEVFVPVQAGLSLPAFLSQSRFSDDETIGGVGVFWRVSHYSGHFLRPQSGRFAEYDLCASHGVNKHIKAIVRGATRSLAPAMQISNAHYMHYAPGWRCVTEANMSSEGCSDQDLGQYLYSSSWARPPSVHFQLNHYALRSIEDYLIKMLRGTFFRSGLPAEYHIGHRHLGYWGISACAVTVDEPTRRAAVSVEKLRAQLQVPAMPWSPTQVPPMSESFRAFAPSLAEFHAAVLERTVWDEEFYLSSNANRSACLPSTAEMDGLLTFWAANKNSTAGGCSVRFVLPEDFQTPRNESA
jgi:solute carrier family 35 protein E3